LTKLIIAGKDIVGVHISMGAENGVLYYRSIEFVSSDEGEHASLDSLIGYTLFLSAAGVPYEISSQEYEELTQNTQNTQTD
jgi:hypothetical protein